MYCCSSSERLCGFPREGDGRIFSAPSVSFFFLLSLLVPPSLYNALHVCVCVCVCRSEGKVCGICMEVVVAKPSLSERRFAILCKWGWGGNTFYGLIHVKKLSLSFCFVAECDHCFCLGCIRKWRGSTHSRKKTIRCVLMLAGWY